MTRMTHLLSWLEQGYTNCKYGSYDWCTDYLTNARDELVRLDARVDELLEANNRYQQEARDARAEVLRLNKSCEIEVRIDGTTKHDFEWNNRPTKQDFEDADVEEIAAIEKRITK